MKTFFKGLLIACLVLAALGTLIYQNSFHNAADAATRNPGPTLIGYQVVTQCASAITATTAAISKVVAPWPIRVGCFYAVATAVTGSVSLDLVNAAGTSLLASKVTLSTVVSEGTLTTNSSTLIITDESWFALNTSNTGTANNVTVTLCTKRQ